MQVMESMTMPKHCTNQFSFLKLNELAPNQILTEFYGAGMPVFMMVVMLVLISQRAGLMLGRTSYFI